MNGTAPIYLLLKGEVDGPHECFDVEGMLEDGELSTDSLASIEGMKSWRSVLEAIVWSKAKVLDLIRPEAALLVRQMANSEVEVREARLAIKQLLMRKNILMDSDALGKVLYANAQLQIQHGYFWKQSQGWDRAVCEAFPAFELYKLGQQDFPRDWVSAWQSAGGQLFDGRMIARKDNAVWSALSDFGFPFPPFSLDVAFWTQDISFDEAERIGIVRLRDVIQRLPEVRPFTPFFAPPTF